MTILQRVKGANHYYLLRMEKANREAFGGERPDYMNSLGTMRSRGC